MTSRSKPVSGVLRSIGQLLRSPPVLTAAALMLISLSVAGTSFAASLGGGGRGSFGGGGGGGMGGGSRFPGNWGGRGIDMGPYHESGPRYGRDRDDEHEGRARKARRQNAAVHKPHNRQDHLANHTLRPRFVVPPADERRYIADEVVLVMPSDLPARTIDTFAKRHHLTRIGSQSFSLTGETLYRWRIDDGRSVADVIGDLQSEDRIIGAQPNFTFTLQDTAAAEGDPAQYALAKLHIPEAHRLANGDHVLVAVIDSSIDASQPELAGVIAATFDAVGGVSAPHSHGTAMAGAIAAHGKLLGVAPHVRLLAIRAFDDAPTGAKATTFGIVRGLDWAVAHGARVVNMSFAGPADAVLQDALAKARKKGLVLVAAAGNGGPKSAPLYPAADPNVVAVTATDADDKLFAQANRGSYIALAAPGVDILGPAPGGGVQLSSGTSVAAAQVSGIAALLIERDPSLTPDEARKALTSTARHLGPKARDNDFGAGLADAWQALKAVESKSAER